MKVIDNKRSRKKYLLVGILGNIFIIKIIQKTLPDLGTTSIKCSIHNTRYKAKVVGHVVTHGLTTLQVQLLVCMRWMSRLSTCIFCAVGQAKLRAKVLNSRFYTKFYDNIYSDYEPCIH